MGTAKRNGIAHRESAAGGGELMVSVGTMLRWIRNARLVVIDDLGVGAIAGTKGGTVPAEAQDAIQRMLDAVTGYLVVTSNLAPTKLGQVTNERIASRCLGGLRLEMRGNDWRLKGAKSGRVE
jgi:DNA replication protein DnaC